MWKLPEKMRMFESQQKISCFFMATCVHFQVLYVDFSGCGLLISATRGFLSRRKTGLNGLDTDDWALSSFMLKLVIWISWLFFCVRKDVEAAILQEIIFRGRLLPASKQARKRRVF